MKPIVITTFTDPMMGLSYECEPVCRQLETHFGQQLKFRYAMGVLVGDVSDFMITADGGSVERYCQRLADIYRAEENISGMPINMEGFCLFDEEHRSSRPLCLSYKAVQQAAPALAERFLYRLRYATVVETRPTTHRDELLRVVRLVGVDEEAFLRAYDGGSADAALRHDQQFMLNLGIRSLPTCLLQSGEQGMLVSGVAGFDTFAGIIDRLTDGTVVPQPPEPTTNNLRHLLAAHPLISMIEISHAFALHTPKAVQDLVRPLIENGEIALREVPGGLFIETINNDNENDI